MRLRTRLAAFVDDAQTGYWFVPTILVLLAVVAATATVWIDEALGLTGDAASVLIGGPEGARTLLSTSASALITTAGVTFSIAIVAVTVATAQFGPRLLRNFLQDRGSQLSLGAILATFVYNLLVLRTIRGGDEGTFVPQTSVTIALALTLGSVLVLIYFIHHAVSSIQVANILHAAGTDLDAAARRLYPSEIGRDATPGTAPVEVPPPAGGEVLASRTGYVESVDGEVLVRVAATTGATIHLAVRPGSFVEPGVVLAHVVPAEASDAVESIVRTALLVRRARTERQDIEFAIQQFVQVAARALSPAYNDPFTAVMAIDRLAPALSDLAARPWPTPERCDATGTVRVVADTPAFPVLVSQAIGEIRSWGRASLTVTVRLLEALALIGRHATREEDRAAILRQARRCLDGSAATLTMPHERLLLASRMQDVETALSASVSAPLPPGR